MEFAEENLQSDAPEPSLQRLMDDLGVHKLQLTREIAIVCQDAEWKTDAPDVLELAKYMFGVVTNTKWTLEDIFNELRVSIALASRSSFLIVLPRPSLCLALCLSFSLLLTHSASHLPLDPSLSFFSSLTSLSATLRICFFTPVAA